MKCKKCNTRVDRSAEIHWNNFDGYCDDCYAEKLPQHDTVESRLGRVNQVRITLNGKDATIVGWQKRFATVAQFPNGLSAQWSWEAVDRVVAKGGAFRC